ncbi:anaerobic ribonucleoside-triphosphate reductase activating protein [Rubellicoccus peritrichatus]|uniref:Anaerobic ribonucleoside-triphosphate reductase activating protein n=1 Tax=Rubellicoccus peritrichatus TaxID=3080537 RepID=A0AAQ3LA83_9BACT|nr:anaerobic ribonucleoside-triphosphate reductase activating protein [Puniceicoccus sp. CR14]WOO40225.1 anaerobic ribonucleoside-triphosphate reductase activating protein [Puniceicoccus sp. CR14]
MPHSKTTSRLRKRQSPLSASCPSHLQKESCIKIGGILCNSLIDFPGRPALVIFMQGCDWRCPYCHNARLIPEDAEDTVDEDNVFEILRERPQAMRNLVVTGGEPTKQDGLLRFLEKAKMRDIPVKLDTNGSNPNALRQVIEKDLVAYVALDVKGPVERYARYCGTGHCGDAITESICILLENRIDYEFRTTVVPALHSPKDFESIGRMLKGGRHLFLQPFRSRHALRARLRLSREPSPEFIDVCADYARRWIPTTIRW